MMVMVMVVASGRGFCTWGFWASMHREGGYYCICDLGGCVSVWWYYWMGFWML